MSNAKKSWVKSTFNKIPTIEQPAHGNAVANGDEKQQYKRKLNNANNLRANKQRKDSLTLSGCLDEFEPNALEDLAVHTKKIDELQNWLEHLKDSPSKICLITGPSGCGKTSTMRLLAKAHKYQLHEWVNPVDQEVITTLDDTNKINNMSSQTEAFKRFLFQASRYKSLLDKFDKRLLLVEDFPNALILDTTQFESILEEYTKYGISPLVFIAAESKFRSLNISYNLFPDDVKEKYHITHINLNAIAVTLMKKAVKRCCTIMQYQYSDTYQVPSQTVVDSIIVCAQGDIRNALINLHFGSLRGAPPMQTKSLDADKQEGGKKKTKKSLTLQSLGCDESLTLMHAVGRVLHPKYTESGKLVHSPEEIANAFASEPKKFLDFVHANYLVRFGEVANVTEAADGLSQAEIMLNEYRENALSVMGLNIGIGATMVANRTPTSGWLPVRGPKRLHMVQETERTDEMKMYMMRPNISLKLYATEYSSYVKCILKNKSNVATSSII